MIAVYGWRSRVSFELNALLPATEAAVRGDLDDDPPPATRFFFACGLIRPKRQEDQSDEERAEGWWVNAEGVVRACDTVIAREDAARICVIGSESGYRGSFDETYACAKARLHDYVETKRLRTTGQQLVAISPGIIADTGMTMARKDLENLARRRAAHPKGRFLMAREVAAMAFHLLYVDLGYTSGTVIRMHGGEP